MEPLNSYMRGLSTLVALPWSLWLLPMPQEILSGRETFWLAARCLRVLLGTMLGRWYENPVQELL